MNPKPSKVQRLDRKKAVTLISGVVCKDAIVFGADSEESGGTRKSTVSKISHSQEGMSGIGRGLSGPRAEIMIAGAGNATLSDYATQEIVQGIKDLTKLPAIKDRIEEILIKIHQVNIPLHPVNDPRETDFELLIGIKVPDIPRPILYSTQGVTVVRRKRYFVSGSGALMDYVLDQLYTNDMLAEDGVAATLYMLEIAKKYVSGVSGESVINVLGSDGNITNKPFWEISEEENLMTQFAWYSGRMLLATLRTRDANSLDAFDEAAKSFIVGIRELRKRKKRSDAQMDALRKALEKKIDNQLGEEFDVDPNSE